MRNLVGVYLQCKLSVLRSCAGHVVRKPRNKTDFSFSPNEGDVRSNEKINYNTVFSCRLLLPVSSYDSAHHSKSFRHHYYTSMSSGVDKSSLRNQTLFFVRKC